MAQGVERATIENALLLLRFPYSGPSLSLRRCDPFAPCGAQLTFTLLTFCSLASSLSISAMIAELPMSLPPVTFYLGSQTWRSVTIRSFLLTSDPKRRILGSYADP